MDNKSRNPVIPRSSLISAIRRLLSPLAKLMLAQGITYPFLAEMLKTVLVDAARKNFGLGQKRLTHSRITVLTGATVRTLASWLPAQAPRARVAAGTPLCSANAFRSKTLQTRRSTPASACG